jgi:pimeloyl-ACP methyl ester carboxylesterase
MTAAARVVLLGWGNATPSQLVVYQRLYKLLGLESVTVIADTVAGLTDPAAYARSLAPLAAQLAKNDQRALLVHLFSDNGFIAWAALLDALAATEGGRRARDAIRGVVLDCSPGLWNVRGPLDFARRFALGMTPAVSRLARLGARERLPFVTPLLAAGFLGYQLVFRRSVKTMLSAAARVTDHQPRCPHLFLYGEADVLVPAHDVRAWIARQRAAGIEAEDQAFADARHVALFPKDPKRYKATVTAFVTRVLTTLTVLLLVMVAVSGCRRRKADPTAAHEPLAAGGAEVEDGDAGDALVEDARRYAVRTWSFGLDRYEMKIEDVGMGTALDALLERTGAELAVNGGFFDPTGKPLGLAMSDGAVLSRLATAASGGVVTFDGERARLWETETFSLPEGTRFAIQCRPRLVVDGAPNVRRDDGQRSERTALCLRDGGKTIEVLVVKSESGEVSGPSLYALGRFLARRHCEGALNLDGGPSTGVAWRENGAVSLLAPRRPVRHAVLFKRRAP